VQLLQRFYDISSGEIKLDGIDIRDLNLGWLRSQFGLVSQEPILFNLSIYENIKLGKEGATRMEIEEAAKTAFAHDFITRLPDVR
jgi:ATP-binding cassette subfamily B (MDR/TAP) protein 1